MGDGGRNAEYDGDIKEQTRRVNKTITKCFYHEYSKCVNQKCELRHPSKVCKDHNMNKCYLGKYCNDNYPKKNCTLLA